jgi:hypothetical protein
LDPTLDNTNMERDNTNMEKDMEKDLEEVKEDFLDPEKPQDPFAAGEVEGGVRYRSMKWW